MTQLYLLDCLLLNDFHDNKKKFDFHAYEMDNEDLEKEEADKLKPINNNLGEQDLMEVNDIL